MLKRFMLLLSALSLNACGTGTLFQQPDFYLLSALAPINTTKPARGAPLVGLKPVKLPKYLDTSRIVTLKDGTALDQAAGHLWAEPLEDSFTRVLSINLAGHSGMDWIYTYPDARPADIVIEVNVADFAGSFLNGVKLHAHWSISGNKGKRILHEESLSLQRDVTGTDYAALTLAMSRVVDDLAVRIAAVLVKLT